MKKVAPALSDECAKFYESNFSNVNAGVTFVLESFPVLYQRAMFEIKARSELTRNELCLIIDAFNGLALTPGLAGQHITLEVSDGIDLEGLDKKWDVDKAAIMEKLSGLSIFLSACLEIWAKSFWSGKREGQEPYAKIDLEEYVRKLAAVTTDRMQALRNRRGEDFARVFENALNSVSPNDLSDKEFAAHEKWVDDNWDNLNE